MNRIRGAGGNKARIFPPMPYIDTLLSDLRSGNEQARALFGRHIHWGYWDNPEAVSGTDSSTAEFRLATENMSRKLCDAARIGDGMRVLDCGCGFGGTLLSLNERFERMQLTGLNIDRRQFEFAEDSPAAAGGGRGFSLVAGDACQLPFSASSFDAVVAIACAHHFASRRRFLKEAHRVLRPGGVLAAAEWLPSSVLGMTGFLMASQVPSLAFFAPLNPWTPPARIYGRMARSAGFTNVQFTNMTANTMPTYAVVDPYYRTVSRRAWFASRLTAKACQYKVLNYAIVTCVRP